MEVIARWENKQKRFAYGCAAARRKGPRACANDHLVWLEDADAAILKEIESILNPERIQKAVDRALARLTSAQSKTRRAKLDAEARDLEKRIRTLVEKIEDGEDFASLKEVLRQRESRLQEVRLELKALDGQQAALDPVRVQRDLLKRVNDCRGLLRKRHEQGRMVLRKLLGNNRIVFEARPEGKVAFSGTGTFEGLFFEGAIAGWSRAGFAVHQVASPSGTVERWQRQIPSDCCLRTNKAAAP
jgi:hypothetical protein